MLTVLFNLELFFVFNSSKADNDLLFEIRDVIDLSMNDYQYASYIVQ